ncbi:hypothetical protein F2P81_012671 [Scophthalmus maximus]|uniref:Uncharacterized protein n=1 Tax=Scophthalmus maximus TaxID=52904 RepID=A0A6A4SLF0_SCOMX|nr:hypothetical protein F2P81_012671 [Scophthalmus maximus]
MNDGGFRERSGPVGRCPCSFSCCVPEPCTGTRVGLAPGSSGCEVRGPDEAATVTTHTRLRLKDQSGAAIRLQRRCGDRGCRVLTTTMGSKRFSFFTCQL